MTGAATYEIRVAGHLDDHWADRLGGLAITRNVDGTTTLAGLLADQSELYGVLSGLRDIGASLIALERNGRPHPEGEDHVRDD
jgi:hypothetical protein